MSDLTGKRIPKQMLHGSISTSSSSNQLRGNVMTSGLDGKSAYEYAVSKGYEGTEEEFAEKLATEWARKEDIPENLTGSYNDLTDRPVYITVERPMIFSDLVESGYKEVEGEIVNVPLITDIEYSYDNILIRVLDSVSNNVLYEDSYNKHYNELETKAVTSEWYGNNQYLKNNINYNDLLFGEDDANIESKAALCCLHFNTVYPYYPIWHLVIDETFEQVSSSGSVRVEIYCAPTNIYHKLDERLITYIPSDWEQTDKTAVGYINNKPFYEERNTVWLERNVRLLASIESYNSGYFTVPFSNIEYDVTRLANAEAIIIVDGQESRTTGYETDTEYVFEYTINDVSRSIRYRKNDKNWRVYPPEKKKSHVFSIAIIDIDLKQLDEKYIPDTFLRRDTLDGIINQIEPDWGQCDENAYSYIKGRTHYTEYNYSNVLLPVTTYTTSYSGANYNYYSGANITDMTTMLKSGYVYRVTYNDTDYIVEAIDKGSGNVYVGNLMYSVQGFNVSLDNGLPFYINGTQLIVSQYTNEVTLSIAEQKIIVHQLDDKYIPDTIARKSDIVTGGTGGYSVFTVTITGDEENGYSADKTFAEIVEANSSEKNVVAKLNYDGVDFVLYLNAIFNNELILFSCQRIVEVGRQEGLDLCIAADESIRVQRNTFSIRHDEYVELNTTDKTLIGSINELKSKFGDIESICDEVIILQNSYINGVKVTQEGDTLIISNGGDTDA